ncbi:MAG: hypothetical protein P1V51_06740 [Deltaproteobacteria bacterium]|nr:hypothetical protein [Deltaproteobacteria bacterium]
MAVSNSLEVTKGVQPPRAVAVRFPFGHATGEVGNVAQQRRVLLEALALLARADEPTVEMLAHLKWRRTKYDELGPVVMPDGRELR